MSSRDQAQATPAPAKSSSTRTGFLQRKCACGGTPGLDGECAGCRRKRVLGRRGLPIQTKLTVTSPGDPYERESDRAAGQVVNMPEPHGDRQAKPLLGWITPLVPRKLEEEDELLLTRQDEGRTPGSSTEVEARIRSLGGGGQPLPEQVLGFFEPRFGHRFDHVRVHTDDGAARAVNARAFTVGSDIVFGPGQFAPETLQGKRLLAHELTHVVQQSRLGSRPVAARVPVRPIGSVLQRLVEVEDPRITGEEVLTHGIVYKQKGAELRDKPAAGSGAQVKRTLPFNTKLFVDRKTSGDWYHVTLTTGEFGYVAASDVKTNLPEPQASLHLIKSGESAIGIAERYYKGDAQNWGEDLRFFVNVLEHVNGGKGLRGVYREKPGDSEECPRDISEVQSWKCVKTRADYLIWIPSVPFAKSLKGTVGTGSITHEAWTAVKEAAIAVGEFIVGGGAFIAGLLHGALGSVWDLLVGLKDLAVMVWDLLKSLVTGEILGDAKKLWDQISNLDVSKLVEAWIDDFVGKWNNESLLKRWHFRGWVIGYAIAEIAMWWFSGGAAAAAKWSGKMAKVAKVIAELPGVARVVTKAKSVKVPPALKSALKTGGEVAGDALKVARAWAATKLNIGAEILKDLTLEAIERLKRLPEATLELLRRFDTPTKLFVLGCASPCKVDIDAIKAYVHAASQVQTVTGKVLSNITEVLDALPADMNKLVIGDKLKRHKALMEAISGAALTADDFKLIAKFMTEADKLNPKTAYQTFTRYLTSMVPARISPDITKFNEIAEAMVKAEPRAGSALKGPMFETFAKLRLGRFRNLSFGRASFSSPLLKKVRTSDGFIESSEALWDFKHTVDKVPRAQAQDYLTILTQGIKSTDGKKVSSINYLFPTKAAADRNVDLKVLGFKVFYVKPPDIVSEL